MATKNSTKKTYLYQGHAYRQDPQGRYYYLATDNEGKPVQYTMYCRAVSAAQAGNFFKLRLRNKYGSGDPIKLIKKFMYVKKEEEKNEEK